MPSAIRGYTYGLSSASPIPAAVQLADAVATSRDLVLPPTATYTIAGSQSIGLPAGWYRVQLSGARQSSCTGAASDVCVRNGRTGGSRRSLQATAGVVGFAAVRVEVNAPPVGGSVSASPPSGVSGSTRFELTASGFSDDHPPLRYGFWSQPVGTTTAASRTPLAPESELPVLRGVILPEGTLTIGCTATDAYGASADAAFVTTVQVSAPTMSSEECSAASAAAASEGSASGSAQLTAVCANILTSGGGTGSAEDRMNQAGALINSLASSFELAAGDPAMIGALANQVGALAGSLDVSGDAGKAAAVNLLGLVNNLLEPANIGRMPPAQKNNTLGALGGTLSTVLGLAAASPPASPPPPTALPPPSPMLLYSTPSAPGAPPAPGGLPHLWPSPSSGWRVLPRAGRRIRSYWCGPHVDRRSDQQLKRRGFELNTTSFQLLAARREPTSLPGATLSANAAGATFALPRAAVDVATALAGADDSLDVQLTSFASDPYSYHPSAARRAGVASGFTLRRGSNTLELSGLPAPRVRIRMPLHVDLSMEDNNPQFGSRCGEGSRLECEAELREMNVTYTEKAEECEGLEQSMAVAVFNQEATSECNSVAQMLKDRMDVKERECERFGAAPCSGRGICNANGTCVCDMPYFGTTCGNVLTCAFWNASASMADADLPGRGAPADADTILNRADVSNAPSGSFDGRGCTAVGIENGQAVCDCTHLTLFEMLWETEWWSQETYATIAFPTVNMPFSRWSTLWSDLNQLGWQAYVLTGAVLGVLTILLFWARYQDEHHEYTAYMPTWYRQVRAVENMARGSHERWKRVLAMPLLFILWFLTNHPWIVVFLVKPSDNFRHAHLVIILYNMILAELCFFMIFFGHDDAYTSPASSSSP